MNITELTDFLLSVPLFSSASPSAIRTILEKGDCRLQQLAPGDTVGTPRQRELAVVVSGKLVICPVGGSTTVILRTLGPREVCGAASLFSPDSPEFSHVKAKEKSTVLLLGHAPVRELLATDAQFLDAYLSFLSGRVQFLNRKIECFTAGTTLQKLACRLAFTEGDTLSLTDSLSSLAKSLNIGRASLYRALDRLEADGFLERCGREMKIVNKEKLIKAYQA